MINVAYFSNQFASAQGHGIAHYARRVYAGVTTDHGDINLLPVATGCDRAAEECAVLEREIGLLVLPWGRKLTPLAWAFLNAPPVEHWVRERIDITHVVSLGFPVATRRKLVVTVHDIGPLTHPEYFYINPWKFRRSFEQMVRQADEIICVSQATADEVVGYAGESLASRISVIHEGVDVSQCAEKSDEECRSEVAAIVPMDKPFFMAAGAISPRKNIARTLKAFAKVKDKNPHHFVLTGGGGWNEGDINTLIAECGLSGRVHRVGYVSDEVLHSLYRTAGFYVHVSLFEGFGLTVLEAMAAGCPVITSNISSLPEVAGDAAVLVDPASVDDIAGALEALAVDTKLCDDFRLRGIRRADQFRWSDCASAVADIYRRLS